MKKEGPVRVLIAALFVLSVAQAWAEEYSPLAPADPPVLEPKGVDPDTPKAPLGLSPYATKYALISNTLWLGARQVKSIHSADPDATDPAERQDYGYIWGTRCLPSQQKVLFTKRFWLPGPAKNFGADIVATKYGAIKEIRVFINDKLAILERDVNNSAYIPLADGGPARFFEVGNNLIRIEVTKYADPPGVKLCSRNGPLGISFEMYGEFSADLQKKFPGMREYAKQLEAGQTRLNVQGVARVTNRGPALVWFGQYFLFVGGGGEQLGALEVLVPLNAFDACDRVGNSIECELKKWPPGESKIFRAGMKVRVDPNKTGDSYLEITTNVKSFAFLHDPNPANNGGVFRVWLCPPGNSNPKCSLPPPPPPL